MSKKIVYASPAVTRKDNPRVRRNDKLANQYRNDGYEVHSGGHNNHAFWAVKDGKVKHTDDEREAVKICAENGLSAVLEPEGIVKITLPNGHKLQVPSADGFVHNLSKLSIEIMAMRKQDKVKCVVEAIKHSYKPFPADMSKSVQADIAVSFAPEESGFHREDIDNGVAEFKRQVRDGETTARPLIYLHIDEENRKVYYRNIKV